MKVALIQMNSQADKARNLEQARALIEQAVAEERPDLVALPEIWPLLSDDDAAKRAAAEPVPGGEAYGLLQELAARHRIVLHGGSIIERDRGERDGEAIYNTTVVFDRDGRELARYRLLVGPSAPNVDHFARYFLMPRRPDPDARWVLCYDCDLSPFGDELHVVWQNDAGIVLGRLPG